ncbi:hypothetical protein EMIT0111MI5_50456 [Burkholderia sp. IT-111MI5]
MPLPCWPHWPVALGSTRWRLRRRRTPTRAAVADQENLIRKVIKRLSLVLALLATLTGGIGVYAVATAALAHTGTCSGC